MKQWACPCCDVDGVQPNFRSRLGDVERSSGLTLSYSSVYRCEKHNRVVGGSPRSAHLEGIAVDIVTPDSHTRFRVLRALIKGGFTRIGIYQNHIHADQHPEHPQQVAWVRG